MKLAHTFCISVKNLFDFESHYESTRIEYGKLEKKVRKLMMSTSKRDIEFMLFIVKLIREHYKIK